MNKLINEERAQISHAEEFQIIYVDTLPSLLLRRGRHIVTPFQKVQYRRKKRIILQRKNY